MPHLSQSGDGSCSSSLLVAVRSYLGQRRVVADVDEDAGALVLTRRLDVRGAVAGVAGQQRARGGLLATPAAGYTQIAALDGALCHADRVDPSEALHEARELVAVLAAFGQDAGRLLHADDLDRPVCGSGRLRALRWWTACHHSLW